MTREDIIRMAREAGIGQTGPWFNCVEEELERFANLVAAAEREACAKVCEELRDDWLRGRGRYEFMGEGADYCAEAIRARGEKLSSQDNLTKSPTNRRYTCHVCNRQEMVKAKFDEESG